MANKLKTLKVCDQIKTGLEECLAHAKGELTLAKVRLPAPPPKMDTKKIVYL